MAHPVEHAQSSARKFGGVPDDYQRIHNWFDESKSQVADFRHRALRHHCEGIFQAERLFGATIQNSDGKKIPVRYIGEQHVREDLGRIPSFQDWIAELPIRSWMYGRRLSASEEHGNELRSVTQSRAANGSQQNQHNQFEALI